MPVSVDERVSTEPRLKRSSNSVDNMLPKFLCELLDVTALRQQAWPSIHLTTTRAVREERRTDAQQSWRCAYEGNKGYLKNYWFWWKGSSCPVWLQCSVLIQQTIKLMERLQRWVGILGQLRVRSYLTAFGFHWRPQLKPGSALGPIPLSFLMLPLEHII